MCNTHFFWAKGQFSIFELPNKIGRLFRTRLGTAINAIATNTQLPVAPAQQRAAAQRAALTPSRAACALLYRSPAPHVLTDTPPAHPVPASPLLLTTLFCLACCRPSGGDTLYGCGVSIPPMASNPRPNRTRARFEHASDSNMHSIRTRARF